MSRSDDFYDVVMHHVTPENLSTGANNSALGDLHFNKKEQNLGFAKDASNRPYENSRSANFYMGKAIEHDNAASKALNIPMNAGKRSASFQYDYPNVDYLS